MVFRINFVNRYRYFGRVYWQNLYRNQRATKIYYRRISSLNKVIIKNQLLKKILYIGNKLSQHGYNKTTIETLGKVLEADGYQLFYASSKRNQILRLFDMIFATIRLANKVDFILIDSYSTISFWYTFVCSQLARVFKTNYIPILHGGNLPKRLIKNPRLCNMIFANSYTNVAPSNYLKTAFIESGFQNTIYIPNGFDLQDYSFLDRKMIQPKLLWVRAFDAMYNPKMAVDVLIELQKKYSDATLTMVGPDKDGSLQITKRYAKQYNLNVSFTGKLTKQQWTALAADCTVFINTTHVDNTPISVIEAMALGLPVVSTNVGGLPYLIDSDVDGLLVNDNDVLAMASDIVKLLQNQTFSKQMTYLARQKVASFDWKLVKVLWNNLLKSK